MPRIKPPPVPKNKRDELNDLAGVYALSDAERIVVQQMMEQIEAYNQEAQKLALALYSAVAKFAGVPQTEEAQHYGFGAAHDQLIVFDARAWTITEEEGLVPVDNDPRFTPDEAAANMEAYEAEEAKLTEEELAAIREELLAEQGEAIGDVTEAADWDALTDDDDEYEILDIK